MRELAIHKPALATVLDLEREEQLTEVTSWAEEAAQYVGEAVIMIPKVSGIMSRLPRRIGGKEVWLAYSLPTLYGASEVPLWEFAGWPVHLLGGSPQKQRDCWRYLRCKCEVRSLDGNMSKKMATGRCCYWRQEKGPDGHWWRYGRETETGAPDECLRRSLVNIKAMWQGRGQSCSSR